jgi:hypothetical protein
MSEFFEEPGTLYEQAMALLNLLIDEATGGNNSASEYEYLRNNLINDATHLSLLPVWIKTNRNLSQFWSFIKYKFKTYRERREFIWNEFQPLLSVLENSDAHPAQENIDFFISDFDAPTIKISWSKCIERKDNDPEGAITMARTLLESVCKHILDKEHVAYSNSVDLSELYKLAAKQLNMAPEQHTENVFKQILGGCSGVVNGLGNLRNRHGDAHGKGLINVRPKPRHAELAVNLAGSMALFLLSSYKNK